LTTIYLFSWFSNKQLSWFSKDSSSGDGKTKDVLGDDRNGSSKDSNNPGSSKAGLGGVAGIMDSMENFKTAQQVGKMTNALVQELVSMTIEGQAAEGKVKVYFDGQQRPVNVQIDEGYLESADVADLNTALTAAMKDAYQKSSERMDEKMKSFYVDLGLKENK
jgi:DNA-binding YbaB/EbfC family protein